MQSSSVQVKWFLEQEKEKSWRFTEHKKQSFSSVFGSRFGSSTFGVFTHHFSFIFLILG